MWPFRRTEARAVAGGDLNATDALVAALVRQADGTTADPDALAVAEACTGLWERCIGSATVAPPSMALAPVGAWLALVGRMLAMRGNAVFAIDTTFDGLRLLPVSSFDVRGEGDPAAWRYRADLAGPSRTRTLDLPAAAVLHFRIGCDAASPWRGRSPLHRARATAALAARIESAMEREASVPAKRIQSYPVTADQAEKIREAIQSNAAALRGPIAHFIAASTNKDKQPNDHYRPAIQGPAPDQVLEALRTQTGRDLAAAYGISPTLFAAQGDGSGQREAWRRFWAGTVAPVGRMIQTELQVKLDPASMVTFDALRASDEDGRSRAVARRAAAFKTLQDAGLPRERALEMAGLA